MSHTTGRYEQVNGTLWSVSSGRSRIHYREYKRQGLPATAAIPE